MRFGRIARIVKMVLVAVLLLMSRRSRAAEPAPAVETHQGCQSGE